MISNRIKIITQSKNIWLLSVFSMLVLLDVVILFNIPFFRQIMGFLFLTIIPGFLILRLLKLNGLSFPQKFVLSVGLSISFLIICILLVDLLLIYLGYKTPLATIPLLVVINIFTIILVVLAHNLNSTFYFFPSLELSNAEKAVLIIPLLFPTLIIIGITLINSINDNKIVIFTIFLILSFSAFVALLPRRSLVRLYPTIIFSISISLLILMALRSNHIIGMDSHIEYYSFQVMINSECWMMLGMSSIDACLSISLLPAIYYSFLNISPEVLFKIMFPLIFSISAIVVYIISEKYIGETYAFLASWFFMFQENFLATEANARTNIAILFFALTIMILFSEKVPLFQKKVLSIIFMITCTFSHYATTYIALFVFTGYFIGAEVLSKKYAIKRPINLAFIILLFIAMFLWYSQITQTAFYSGVLFIQNTLINLNNLFILESRGSSAAAVMGVGLNEKGVPQKINFYLSWITFFLIGIGFFTTALKYKEIGFRELNYGNIESLEGKFEVAYFLIASIFIGILISTLLVPYFSVGYNLDRVYTLAITIICPFFIIGGISLANILLRIYEYAYRGSFSDIDFRSSKSLKVLSISIILIILFPYSLCSTGVMYNLFGNPMSILLNSNGVQYDVLYVHDQESCASRWLQHHSTKESRFYMTDGYGGMKLISQGTIHPSRIEYISSIIHGRINNITLTKLDKNRYIYLYYNNVVNKTFVEKEKPSNVNRIEGFEDIFRGDYIVYNNEIYDNSGSEVWRYMSD